MKKECFRAKVQTFSSNEASGLTSTSSIPFLWHKMGPTYVLHEAVDVSRLMVWLQEWMGENLHYSQIASQEFQLSYTAASLVCSSLFI